MLRRILVPVDGSTFAEHAIPYATSIAAATEARVEFALVHLHYRAFTADLALRDAINEWEDEHRRSEADYLHQLADRVGAGCGRDIDPVLLTGDIVPELRREVQQTDTSLVVMATHASTGFERAWLGSVADVLVRLVEAPVLLIRPSDREPVRADGVPRFTHVLIALDGSRRAERALVPAIELARCHAARVTLLRIVVPRPGTSSPLLPDALLRFARADVAEREQEARAYIDAQVEELQREDVTVSGTVLVAPDPAHTIMEYATANGADLIALGTHGRGPVGRFVLGSVTDAVTHITEVPVLVC